MSLDVRNTIGHKILVMGPPGSGKTRLARQISETLGMTVIHLDREFFLPEFNKPDPAGWLATTRKLADQSQWVMDGNYFDVIEYRLLRADTLIVLDLSWHRCVFRAFMRTFSHLGSTRYDLGQPERVHMRHLVNIVMYRFTKWERIKKVIEAAISLKKSVILLRSDRQVNSFVRSVQS